MRPVNAAALVAAGMLSVLLYPMIARMRLGQAVQDAPGRFSLSLDPRGPRGADPSVLCPRTLPEWSYPVACSYHTSERRKVDRIPEPLPVRSR